MAMFCRVCRVPLTDYESITYDDLCEDHYLEIEAPDFPVSIRDDDIDELDFGED